MFAPKKGLKTRPYKRIDYKIGDAITFKYGKKRLNGLVIGGYQSKKPTAQIRTIRIYNKVGFTGVTQLDLAIPAYNVKKRKKLLNEEQNYLGMAR